MRTPEFENGVIAAMPQLKKFAVHLTGNDARADDLVQDTIIRALSNAEQLQPGTNLPAWLFTILRNKFRSDYRKHKREVEDPGEEEALKLWCEGSQLSNLQLKEMQAAIKQLPADQQETLILVGVLDHSYDEAAEIANVPVGTIKSRLNRARARVSPIFRDEAPYAS